MFEFYSIKRGLSSYLQRASPTAHNIATSKVAVIFTVHLKGGNKSAFCIQNDLNGDFQNSYLANVFVLLRLASVPSRKMII